MTRAGTRSTHTCPVFFQLTICPESCFHSPIADRILNPCIFQQGYYSHIQLWAFSLFSFTCCCDHTSRAGSFAAVLSGYSLFSNAPSYFVHWCLPRFTFFVKVPCRLLVYYHRSITSFNVFLFLRWLPSALNSPLEYLRSLRSYTTIYTLNTPPFPFFFLPFAGCCAFRI